MKMVSPAMADVVKREADRHLFNDAWWMKIEKHIKHSGHPPYLSLLGVWFTVEIFDEIVAWYPELVEFLTTGENSLGDEWFNQNGDKFVAVIEELVLAALIKRVT